jgi:hypothetical protein
MTQSIDDIITLLGDKLKLKIETDSFLKQMLLAFLILLGVLYIKWKLQESNEDLAEFEKKRKRMDTLLDAKLPDSQVKALSTSIQDIRNEYDLRVKKINAISDGDWNALNALNSL